jgi:hypothetical protein
MSVEQYVSSSSIKNAFSDVFVVYIRLLFCISGLHQLLASFIGGETVQSNPTRIPPMVTSSVINLGHGHYYIHSGVQVYGQLCHGLMRE